MRADENDNVAAEAVSDRASKPVAEELDHYNDNRNMQPQSNSDSSGRAVGLAAH